MYVFKIKDIIKYLAIIILLIIVILLCARFFLKSINKKDEEKKEITKKALTGCIETVIPYTEYKEEQNKKESSIQKILNTELGFMEFTKREDSNPSGEFAEEILEEAKTGVKTEVIDSGIENKFTNSYKDVQIKNTSKYDLTEQMIAPNFELTNKKDVIIFHTHTCESYTPSEKYNYEQTGTYRTTDLNYSVARVGTELTNYLNNYGFNVIHDQTYHDYPSYNGSYDRSLETVTNILKENQNTQILIDLHRDAIGANNNYAPKVKIGDEYAAQLMFVIGTDGGGLEHPNWQKNLKFAVKIQEKANEMYPGLFKPIILRNSRYNQNLGDAAVIIEVGATGNTLDECLNSMKYLSKIMDETLNNP